MSFFATLGNEGQCGTSLSHPPDAVVSFSGIVVSDVDFLSDIGKSSSSPHVGQFIFMPRVIPMTLLHFGHRTFSASIAISIRLSSGVSK